MSLPRKTVQEVLNEMPLELRKQVNGWCVRPEAKVYIPEMEIPYTPPGTVGENDRLYFTSYTYVESPEYKDWKAQDEKIRRLTRKIEEVIQLQRVKEYQARSEYAIKNWLFPPAAPKMMTLDDLSSELQTEIKSFYCEYRMGVLKSPLEDIIKDLLKSIGIEPLGPGDEIIRLYNIKTKQLSTPFSIRSFTYTFEPKIEAEQKPECKMRLS